MKTFHCQNCGHPVFFENVKCLQCQSALAFLADRLNMAAIEEVPDAPGLWQPHKRGRRTAQYRLCQNHTAHNACNFAVPATDPNPFCVACRLTRVLPDLTQPENPQRWYRMEVAKRRLFYNLAKLGLLSPNPSNGAADGPIFEFLADTPGHTVLTGHAQGVITLNVAEADEAERTRRRIEMHEPYRTLLGHFRHESGHFYWDRLIAGGGRHEDFRAVFGDEQLNYQQALQDHYARGGLRADWQEQFVSAYASAHPWEDWAETWAHYLHMVDLLETASWYNTRLSIPGEAGQEVEIEEVVNPLAAGHPEFDLLVEQWVPVTLLVNSFNRSLGQEDAYPFALSVGALEKLRFVHDVISQTRADKNVPGQPQPVATTQSAEDAKTAAAEEATEETAVVAEQSKQESSATS